MGLPKRDQGEGDFLAVPVVPGSDREPSIQPVPPPPVDTRRRLLLTAAAAAGVIVIALVTYLLARSPSNTHKPTVIPSPPQRVQKPRPATHHVRSKPKPTPAQTAHATAVKLAAKFPVAAESTALVRRGSSLYLVGGTSRGKPSDGIWRVDLSKSRVTRVGHFLEPLAYSASARRGDVLFLAGGWTGEKVATAVLRWTPDGPTTVVARLPVGVRGARAAFVGAELYVVGGSPHVAYVVDVGTGDVRRVTTVPRAVKHTSSNLAYLTQSVRREP